MSAARRGGLSLPRWVHEDAGSWLFVVRTVVSMLLAIGVAFRLDLSSPGSAAVTVSIIALPQTGMVFEKSFYRLLGTALAAVVTLVLLAEFAQHRNTFIVAVAIWIGLCTAASARFRGFQAYGWLLCGYTTCLVGFPAYMDASHAFDIAVDRVTIVSVGILSAGVVSAVIFPARSSGTLVQSVRGSFIDFVEFLDRATRAGDAAQMRLTQQRFSQDLANLELLRASSVFEDPVSRVRAGRLHDFMGSFMSASSQLHLFHRQLEVLEDHGRAIVVAALEPLLVRFRATLRSDGRVPGSALEARPLVRQFEVLGAELTGLEASAVAALADQDLHMRNALRTSVFMLREVIEETRILVSVYMDLHSLTSRGVGRARFQSRFASDPLHAAVGGIRAGLMIIVTCAFWIASEWPEGFSLCLISSIGCALFALAPNPTAAARQMCAGFLLGVPALVACYSWVLPAANGFPMFCLALLPFLALGAWLMTRPGQALLGSGYFLMFLTGMNLSGRMSYDFIGMFNNALGLVGGILVATLSLAVLAPANPRWRYDRTLRLMLRTLRMAQHGRPLHLRSRFEIRVRDLAVLLGTLRPVAAVTRDDESVGFIITALGDAIIRLRRIAGRHQEPGEVEVAHCIDAVVAAVVGNDQRVIRSLDERLASLCERAGDSLSAAAAAGAEVQDTSTELLVGLRTLRVGMSDLGTAHAA